MSELSSKDPVTQSQRYLNLFTLLREVPHDLPSGTILLVELTCFKRDGSVVYSERAKIMSLKSSECIKFKGPTRLAIKTVRYDVGKRV